MPSRTAEEHIKKRLAMHVARRRRYRAYKKVIKMPTIHECARDADDRHSSPLEGELDDARKRKRERERERDYGDYGKPKVLQMARFLNDAGCPIKAFAHGLS